MRVGCLRCLRCRRIRCLRCLRCRRCLRCLRCLRRQAKHVLCQQISPGERCVIICDKLRQGILMKAIKYYLLYRGIQKIMEVYINISKNIGRMEIDPKI